MKTQNTNGYNSNFEQMYLNDLTNSDERSRIQNEMDLTG